MGHDNDIVAVLHVVCKTCSFLDVVALILEKARILMEILDRAAADKEEKEEDKEEDEEHEGDSGQEEEEVDERFPKFRAPRRLRASA